jgi:hypothetical protein
MSNNTITEDAATFPPPPTPPPGGNEKTSTSLCLLEWKIGKSLQVGNSLFSLYYKKSM